MGEYVKVDVGLFDDPVLFDAAHEVGPTAYAAWVALLVIAKARKNGGSIKSSARMIATRLHCVEHDGVQRAIEVFAAGELIEFVSGDHTGPFVAQIVSWDKWQSPTSAEYHRQARAEAAGGNDTSGNYIYFIGDGERIKIGRSKNPWARLKTLQTSSGNELHLLAVKRAPVTAEAELHQRFADIRLAGEWFRATSELVTFVSGFQSTGSSEVATAGSATSPTTNGDETRQDEKNTPPTPKGEPGRLLASSRRRTITGMTDEELDADLKRCAKVLGKTAKPLVDRLAQIAASERATGLSRATAWREFYEPLARAVEHFSLEAVIHGLHVALDGGKTRDAKYAIGVARSFDPSEAKIRPASGVSRGSSTVQQQIIDAGWES